MVPRMARCAAWMTSLVIAICATAPSKDSELDRRMPLIPILKKVRTGEGISAHADRKARIKIEPEIQHYEADGRFIKKVSRRSRKKSKVTSYSNPCQGNQFLLKTRLANMIARKQAIDLASGKGKIDQESDDVSWEGSPIMDGESRAFSSEVMDGETIITVDDAEDGFASYGREFFPDDFCVKIRKRLTNGEVVSESKTTKCPNSLGSESSDVGVEMVLRTPMKPFIPST